jgi:prephenate dehydrogenase
MSTVAVLGLGLIGGSLARDLHEAGLEVVGYDRNNEVLQAAQASGVLSDVLGANLEGLERMETVVLAVPVGVAPQLLENALPRLQDARLITDVGSTKAAICQRAQDLGLGSRFVGAHPFAGDHRSGWEASRSGLFRDARVFLCPLPDSTADAVERARRLWQQIGAQTEVTTAEEHDTRLAWTSQLPQLASSALALALAAAAVPRAELGRGGLDATRLAGSSPDVWTDVVLENAEQAARAMVALEQQITELRIQIQTRNEAAIHDALAGALRWTLDTKRETDVVETDAPSAGLTPSG